MSEKAEMGPSVFLCTFYASLIGLQFNEMQTITNVWVGEWKEEKLQRERSYLYSPHRKQVWCGVSGVGVSPKGFSLY